MTCGVNAINKSIGTRWGEIEWGCLHGGSVEKDQVESGDSKQKEVKSIEVRNEGGTRVLVTGLCNTCTDV